MNWFYIADMYGMKKLSDQMKIYLIVTYCKINQGKGLHKWIATILDKNIFYKFKLESRLGQRNTFLYFTSIAYYSLDTLLYWSDLVGFCSSHSLFHHFLNPTLCFIFPDKAIRSWHCCSQNDRIVITAEHESSLWRLKKSQFITVA